jgi:hypothetical protein
MQGFMVPNFYMGRIVQSDSRKVPLRTAVFMACISGAAAVELLNLPPRFAFAMVFAALMTVCPDIWVDIPKSPQEELEEVRREIAALKKAKLELLDKSS